MTSRRTKKWRKDAAASATRSFMERLRADEAAKHVCTVRGPFVYVRSDLSPTHIAMRGKCLCGRDVEEPAKQEDIDAHPNVRERRVRQWEIEVHNDLIREILG